MVHKISLPLLLMIMVFLLGFSHVLSSRSVLAVPTTRSLKAYGEHPSPVQDVLLHQDANDLSDGADDEVEAVLVVGIEGRMVMESTVDYPGTGANNHHDPKTPGRS